MATDLERFKMENASLKLENERLRHSKVELVMATAKEIERLRQFINLLARALRGRGFTHKHITNIEKSMKSSHNNNKFRHKSASDWSYKKKKIPINQNKKTVSNNSIKSDWYSKGSIDKKQTQSTSTSTSPSKNSNVVASSSSSTSLKDRMAALKNASNNNVAAKNKLIEMKESRKLNKIKLTTTSKDNIASLFTDKIQKQKKTSAAMVMTGSKGKILKAALKNPQPEQSAAIVESLGLFTVKEKTPSPFKKKNDKDDQKDDEKDEKLSVLNMNNNIMMKKMSDVEKDNMENLICESLIKNQDLKQVKMCNADINDEFLNKILTKLLNEKDNHNITELWLESNPIGDQGFKYLSNFIKNDDKIQVIKLYNNKKTISTPVLNDVLVSLEENKTIVKFVFDGFRFQHQKDKKEKWLRRNADIARKKRNEEKKRLKALQNK